MNAPVPKFMIESTWRGRLFGSEWRAAEGGSIDVVEPATGAAITSVGNAGAKDVRRAAAEARAAQPGWAATPYEKRAAILRKAARTLEDNQEELIPWIARETGGIPAKAGFEIHMVTEILYRSAAMCTEPQGLVLPSDPGRISLARRLPRGVIGIISPFNFPLILSCRAVAPALATGNAVVLKPDPRTPLTGGFAIARIFEEAGLPKGVLRFCRRRRSWRGALQRSGYRHDRVHRFEQSRAPHRRTCRQASQEGSARIGRQERSDRVRGCGSRRGGFCNRFRRLVPPGSNLSRPSRKRAWAPIPRLRNHPSLALWSGNNECDDAFDWATRNGRPAIDPYLYSAPEKRFPQCCRSWIPIAPIFPARRITVLPVVAAGNTMIFNA